jgi:hypothetical protein
MDDDGNPLVIEKFAAEGAERSRYDQDEKGNSENPAHAIILLSKAPSEEKPGGNAAPAGLFVVF